MSLYPFALVVHIAAATHLIGTSLVSPLIVHRVRSAASRDELLQWLGFARQAMRFNPLSAFVLLGTGAWLGASGGSWNSGWFAVSVFAWLLSSALAGAVIKPAAQRIARDGSTAAIGRWAAAEKVMLGSDAAMLWIMVAKPTLFASIAIFLGAIALFVLGGLFVRRVDARAETVPTA